MEHKGFSNIDLYVFLTLASRFSLKPLLLGLTRWLIMLWGPLRRRLCKVAISLMELWSSENKPAFRTQRPPIHYTSSHGSAWPSAIHSSARWLCQPWLLKQRPFNKKKQKLVIKLKQEVSSVKFSKIGSRTWLTKQSNYTYKVCCHDLICWWLQRVPVGYS